ncbi:endothelin-converting enzyme [Cryptococcus deuterogattii LA55]|nr:endothelin-converting enzyme [Cryptococcus deuterogattii LA55]KIR94670.1 endothelin-converting enzyme [Cryptococcus deuterogattii CBS 10090]
MAEPRASIDEVFSRPNTTREKALAAISVLFLLLASLFIGLFAGAESSYKKEKGKHGSGGGGDWATVTETKTDTQTETVTATTTHVSQPTGTPAPSICLTPECVQLSASILTALNTSVDPCDDFYQFATGGWQASNSIPEDRGLYGAFNEVSDNNKKLILKVLGSISDEKPGKDATVDERNLAKLKAVYTSCMDIDTLNDIGEKPLIDLVEHVLDIFGEFDVSPYVDNGLANVEPYEGAYDETYRLPDELIAAAAKVEEIKELKKAALTPDAKREKAELEFILNEVDEARRHKLTKTLAWLHSRGVQGLVNFAIEGDAGGEDSQIQSLWLYQAQGGLPSKEYYDEAPILDLYHSVIHDILTELAKHTSAEQEKRGWVEDLVAVAMEEELIGDESWPWPWPGKGGDGGDDDHRHPPHEPIDKRMDELASQVLKFEKDLVKAGADPEYLTFPENITVTYPPYLNAVTKLVEQTPDEVLSGYFVTRLALTYADALGPKTEVKKSFRRLQEVLKGIKPGTEENRQDVCLAWVDDIVGFIAGREFVREAFSPEAKSEGERIIRSIVSAFHAKLPHISWMDEESAAAAQKKAEAIIPKVGYPLLPDTTKPESLESWYARVDIDKEDFFGNVLRSSVVEESRVWLSLGRRRSRDSWEMYPQTVNAYYSPPDGEIVFPAGILQPPFYSLSWPAHLRYGAFGAVAAHELTHAFDNSGSQYDEKGRLRDWWTKKTVEDFEKRAQCVAKQYSKYWVYDAEGKKVFVNGNAYTAWKSSIPDGSSSERLPGLDYSDEQLFFIAFARVWAQLIRPATAVSRIRTDPHSPPYWRTMEHR